MSSENKASDKPYRHWPLASIIILNYNGIRFIERCLRSILETDYPNFEVILVDNGSTDGSLEIALRLFGKNQIVRIIRNERNLGFAEGNNVGYASSKGQVIVFLNIDTEVERNWLRELMQVLDMGGNIGVAQCKLFSMRDRNKIDSVGYDFDYLGYVYPRSQTRRRDSFDQVEEVLYADGAAMALKRRVLDESCLVGVPFDPDYFCYYEETDLCWRVRLRGYEIMFAPKSVVYHYRGYACRKEKTRPDLVFHYLKNHISTLIKNYNFLNLVRCIPPLITLEVGRALLALKNEPQSALARLRALVWPLKNFGRLWRRRIRVQLSIRKVPDSEILRLMRKPDFNALIFTRSKEMGLENCLPRSDF